MGRDGARAAEREPVFRAALDECAAILSAHLERPLLDVMFGTATATATLLDETQYTQPALVALEWSLSQLWRSWGITPSAVLGHSVGEYAALIVAGVWTLSDGLRVIAERGRLMQELGPGWGMTAVQCSLSQVEQLIGDTGLGSHVAIAAVNTPDNIVLSGRDAELHEIGARLRGVGVLVTRLRVSYGFHSPQMDAVAQEFAQVVMSIPMQMPRVPVISSVTGAAIDLDQLRDSTYWRNQVRNAVQFRQGMASLAKTGATAFLEVGPAPVLIGMGQQCLGDTVAWATSMRKGRDAHEQMLESLAQLYATGVSIDWESVEAGAPRRRVELPTYPFERQYYWIDDAPSVEVAAAWATVHEGAEWQASQGRLDLSLDRYARAWPLLQRMTGAYIAAAFVRLGAFSRMGEVHTAESLIERTGIQPGFAKLIGRWLGRLADARLLSRADDGFVAEQPLVPPDLAPMLREADDVFGSDRIIVDYVIACGSQLTEYITGARSTLETLFPDGSFRRAEDLYERAPLSAYFASIGRAAVEGLVRTRGGSPVRVIEIGAGTGATTSALLPVLPSNGSEYHFTDLSDFFLNHARDKFERYGFMRYGRFDVEENGAAQGFANGAFDLVVATNVLHATRDIRKTLERVRALLAPGGMLLLCEVTTYLPWFDITTALIEGWQLFEDGLRDEHPLLSAEQWAALLEEAGFEHAASLPHAGSPAEVLGQHVMLAHAPGRAATRIMKTSTVADLRSDAMVVARQADDAVRGAPGVGARQ